MIIHTHVNVPTGIKLASVEEIKKSIEDEVIVKPVKKKKKITPIIEEKIIEVVKEENIDIDEDLSRWLNDDIND